MSKAPIHLEDRGIDGARLFSPTASRNSQPIANVLAAHLTKDAHVLEIASGTGQHGAAIVAQCPDIMWQPSDPDAQSRASINDWAKDASGRMAEALTLDMTRAAWWETLPGAYTHIYCANMIHIAPWSAALGLTKGARHILPTGGQFFLYGPFLFGDQSAESNLAFSDRLKLRNPEWGVRELDSVKHIFASAGLSFTAQIAMPKANHILVFTKT